MELHPKQRQLLQLLKDSIDEPYTIRVLKEMLGVSSTSIVTHHIKQLEKKRLLLRNPSNPRDYKILGDPENQTALVNLYGMAQCGPSGTLLSGDPQDRIPLSPKLLSFNIDEAFIVEATGDSMEPDIHQGDFVIAKKAYNCADDGDVIVCTYDDGVRIKKYKKELKLLMSLNPKVDPIKIEDIWSFHIEGVVKGVICNHHPKF